jgi:hypothetical protein
LGSAHRSTTFGMMSRLMSRLIPDQLVEADALLA